MVTSEQLAAIREHILDPTHVGTHWEGCETTHPRCAVRVLLDEVGRMRTELGEWVRAFNLAYRGNPATPEQAEANEKEGFGMLWDLAHGSGWVHQPPCALEATVRERDRLAARVAELEASNRTTPCKHVWVDMRNSVVESGEMCPRCGIIQAGNRNTGGAS
jgi:hypothetical protein